MAAWGRVLWNFIRVFWWVIVLLIVVVLFGFVYFINRKKDLRVETETSAKPPSLVTEAMKHVQEAVTDVKVEKAIIKTKTDSKRAELEDIRRELDGEKRRERLAAILKKSL